MKLPSDPAVDATHPRLRAGRAYAYLSHADELIAGEQPHWQVFNVVSVDEQVARCWFYAERFEVVPRHVVLAGLTKINLHDAPFPRDGPGAIAVPWREFDLGNIREIVVSEGPA